MKQINSPFTALTANPVFFRTYSRFINNRREQWQDTVDRMMQGLVQIGNLSNHQFSLIERYANSLKAIPSGRFCWVGGTEWLQDPENYSGAYNCASFNITSFERMAFMMSLSMQGVGTGTVLEQKYIDQLPKICTNLEVKVIGTPGDLPQTEKTVVTNVGMVFEIVVGDSRQGWCDAYLTLLNLATTPEAPHIKVYIEISHVRAAGTKIKGFGGVTNPIGLDRMFNAITEILNGAIDRQLDSVEICLILDEVSLAIVAGNVRRSANMRQFASEDLKAISAKDNLWGDQGNGVFGIDPKRDALRMGNHTRIFHTKPTMEECLTAVTKQYYSGEGAIMWAGESIARANADLLNTPERKQSFLEEYEVSPDYACAYLEDCNAGLLSVDELDHRMARYGMNPCFAEGTLVLTHEGEMPIELLVGKTVEVWDGHSWVTINSFRVTGENVPIHKVEFNSIDPELGNPVYATLQHTFILEDGSKIQLKDLKVGNKLKGAYIPAKDTNPEIYEDYNGNSFEITAITLAGIAPLVYCCTVADTHTFTLGNGLLVGNCGEIIGSQFMCNLGEVHLNMLDPLDLVDQELAFEASSCSVAVLLNHHFVDTEQESSRKLDPIVGVSFTGLFDFFVEAFGIDWLQWWQNGRSLDFEMSESGWHKCCQIAELFGLNTCRPNAENENEIYYHQGEIYRALETAYLKYWRGVVERSVKEYCEDNGLKVPNRCTTVQPAGSKSLLTGASPGWHPPKAAQFIRRMTFRKDDPVALACIDYGYSVIPSQSDKDEHGNLLDDPFDPRCTEWLVEIPIATNWADLPGVSDIDISQFSAEAQFDFYMIVQQHYTTHNTSATIEFREHEILPLATKIFEAIQYDAGYISAALLARFDEVQNFPRLPFEPIDLPTYLALVDLVKSRNNSMSFAESLAKYDLGDLTNEVGPAGCDSDKCLIGNIQLNSNPDPTPDELEKILN
jgi:hypothetical protein